MIKGKKYGPEGLFIRTNSWEPVITVSTEENHSFTAFLVCNEFYDYGETKFEDDGSFLMRGQYRFPWSTTIVDFEIFVDKSNKDVQYSYPMRMKSWVQGRLIFFAERGDEEEGLKINIDFKQVLGHTESVGRDFLRRININWSE